MASVGDRPYWTGRKNPFPQAAVARVYDSRPDQLTIRTAAVDAVDRLVDGYLQATRAPDGTSGPGGAGGPGDHLAGKGRVCVIEGDYGTGKTHLAMELLGRAEQARAEDGTDTRVVYHVVPGGSFLSLYAGLLKERLGQSEMVARVQEWYADIVADALRERPYTGDLIARLLRDDVDPQLVVERYGLKEGALRDELRRRLAAITGDETFSRVLMLLLQQELRPLAWQWLTGEVPGAVLAERGVTRPIGNDIQAMNALGVVARLHGRRNRRFVLVIDEMEKLAAAWDGGDVTHGQAFKRLLAVFREAGALLVVCGLPDIFEILPRDPGRVDTIIHPPPLTGEDVRAYIRHAQRVAFGWSELRPFTGESAGYISYLTSGVARDVVRICYRAFAEAAETGQEITPATIRQAARERLPDGGADRVRADVAEILNEEGWLPDRHRVPGSPPGAMAADFWIQLGADGAGCAIRVCDSVLEHAEARGLADQAADILSGGADRAVILVVAGYLPAEQRDVLVGAAGEQSLVIYHARTFREDFVRALGKAMERIGGMRPGTGGGRRPDGESRARGAESERMRAESERLGRQQASTLRGVQEMLQRMDALAQAVTDLRRQPDAADGGERGLPPRLEAMFSRARQSLDAYGDIRGFLDKTFEIASRQPGQRFPLTHRLRAPDAFGPIGIAGYLSDLLGSFRASVQSWLAEIRRAPAGEGGPSADDRAWLREICQTYDSLYGVAEVYKLDPLPERIRLVGEPPPRAGRSARREALENAFGDLGDRVYRAALEEAGAGGEEM